MPNWIYNSIDFDDKTDFDAFAGKYCPGGVFSFNAIIPEPETEDDCPDGYRLSPDGKTEDGGHTVVPNKAKPWFNWFSWRCDKWGVKWDASDVAVNAEKLHIVFDTPWCEPIRIYEHLAAEGWRFKFTAVCEYDLWGAEGHLADGVVVVDREWEQDAEDEP